MLFRVHAVNFLQYMQHSQLTQTDTNMSAASRTRTLPTYQIWLSLEPLLSEYSLWVSPALSKDNRFSG